MMMMMGMGSTTTPSPVVVVPQSHHNNLQRVFVYGSLLEDEVVRALLKRVPESSPATLDNYHRFSIKGRVYPAILPVEDKKVTGRILLDITDPELYVLDEFEDVEYERRSVSISLMDTNEKMEAYAYVWANSTDPSLYGEWDFMEWKQKHMSDFLAMTTGFVEELQGPDSKPRVESYESFYQQAEKS